MDTIALKEQGFFIGLQENRPRNIVFKGGLFGENRNRQLFLFRLIKKCKGSLPEQAEMIPI
ncbi:MAG: hypothetical protein ACTSPQ_22225 [Candidatus Helarchaeota archaeon]